MIGQYVRVLGEFMQSYIILFLINFALSMFIVFVDKKKPVSTILWVMAINFLPIIGFILYLIIGKDLFGEKMFDKKGVLSADLRKNAEKQLEEIKTGDLELKDRTKQYLEIIEMFNKGEMELIYTENDIKKYNDGRDMFRDLFEDIENAKTSIYIQSYILKSDELGKKLFEALKAKVKEGVEVILLVDGMGGRNFKRSDMRDLEEAGVKLAIFFPGLFKRINTRVNYRNHRKIIVIDHNIGYVGGLNIGDEYISKNKRFGFWRDTHLRIVGDAVIGLELRLFLDYRFAAKKNDAKFMTTIPDCRKENEKGDKEICIVTSGPDTKVDSIRNGYGKLITRARKSIYIQTPYFIPDTGLYNALKCAALAGCDINIMIPNKRDHPFVHWASLWFLGDLLQWGVKAYLYEGGFLHAKVLLCDDYLSSVGTANFDIRSFELNFEANAFIFDEELNKSLKEDFMNDVKKSTQLTQEIYDQRSAFVKFREGISRLLAPIL